MIIEGNNPHIQPSFSFTNRLRRLIWNLAWLLLFRPSPRVSHNWRTLILRSFGAKVGKGVHIYPAVRIWAPWHLTVGDYVGIADGVVIYNMDLITIGSYSVVSQGAHLCGGSHDYNSPNFQLFAKPITIGSNVWLCADTFIFLGTTIADGVVVGARSVVTKDISESWTIHTGHPAKKIRDRTRRLS